MREFTVKYKLFDEDVERLRKITELYNAKGANFSEESVFESIMLTGSKYNVDDKLKFHEWKLGLRETWHTEECQECRQSIPGNRQRR